jgi:hypothetical protein
MNRNPVGKKQAGLTRLATYGAASPAAPGAQKRIHRSGLKAGLTCSLLLLAYIPGAAADLCDEFGPTLMSRNDVVRWTPLFFINSPYKGSATYAAEHSNEIGVRFNLGKWFTVGLDSSEAQGGSATTGNGVSTVAYQKMI